MVSLAHFTQVLESRTGRRVHELFDVIGGTSTGGILALAIQERVPLTVIEHLYLELASKVFQRECAFQKPS